MMHNDRKRPEIARSSQDVESPPQRVEEAPHHTGRGMSSYSSPCQYWLDSLDEADVSRRCRKRLFPAARG